MPRKKAAKEKAKAVVEESQARDDPEVARLKKHVANLEDQLEESGNPDTHHKVLKLQGELAKLRGQLKSALRLVEIERETNELLVKIANPHHHTWKSLPEKIGRGTMIASCGDWHCEAVITKAKTGGRGENNLDLCHRKIGYLTQKIIWGVNNARSETKVDRLVVALLGDFISGFIHSELVESNALHPLLAIEWVNERIISMPETLKKELKLSITVCTCYGNHGRTTQKPRIATAAENNYEYAMYRSQAKYFRNDPKIHYKVEEDFDNIIDIDGFVVRFQHGDCFKYNGGIGGLTTPVIKKLDRKDRICRADLDIMGHFHTYFPTNRFIVNGSLIGFDPYAKWIAAEAERPMQALTLIDRKHGHVLTRPLFCDGE